MIKQFFWWVLVAIGLATMYSLLMLNPEPASPQSLENQPDFTATNMMRVVYDQQGLLVDVIRAEQMAHFEYQGIVRFKKPIYTLYQAKEPMWQVTSERALLYPEDKLILEQQVELRSLYADSLFTRIETSSVELLINENQLQSSEQVTIFGQGFQIAGLGMITDLNQQLVELKKHTKTVYYNENN